METMTMTHRSVSWPLAFRPVPVSKPRRGTRRSRPADSPGPLAGCERCGFGAAQPDGVGGQPLLLPAATSSGARTRRATATRRCKAIFEQASTGVPNAAEGEGAGGPGCRGDALSRPDAKRRAIPMAGCMRSSSTAAARPRNRATLTRAAVRQGRFQGLRRAGGGQARAAGSRRRCASPTISPSDPHGAEPARAITPQLVVIGALNQL